MRQLKHSKIEEALVESSESDLRLDNYIVTSEETLTLQQNQKILVSDDRLLNIELVKENFKQLELINRSQFFIDGVSLLETAKQILSEATVDRNHNQPIQAIILDYQMPHKNGIDVIKELRGLIDELKI